MQEKLPIADQQAAVMALNELVDTINATGGVAPAYDDVPSDTNSPAPVGDMEWLDLGLAYQLACQALGVPMQWAVDEAEKQNVAVSTTEE
jgi:hypothetical protein